MIHEYRKVIYQIVYVLDTVDTGTLELLLFIHKFLYDAGGDDDDF